MSEVKLISPLLDGFSIGSPMSEHNGVRCCPAIKENTDKKYIVKIISVPAAQAQMDALLLAGAYKDPADAMEYFQQIGEGILKEAELLKTLSKLDGFLPYEGWQMEPITRRRLGYEIYLVGSYKRSLEKYMKNHPATHLEAVNLGLDMCAALTVCREAGALYVALKPSNIFVSEKKEYRIGDLGFMQLDSLSYAALPEKYHSPYTPPELLDPMAVMNLTADTYALGMILYQLYNDGQLPVKGLRMTDQEFLPPVNADYEMAEIIMKAIHLDPEQRWNDPQELGKALASYMQRNAVNDVPITLHAPMDIDSSGIRILPKKEPEQEVLPSETSTEETAAEETAQEAEIPESDPEIPEEVPEVSEAPAADQQPPEEKEDSAEDLEDALLSEETGDEAVSPDPEEPTDALSAMIARADDLISHEIPEDTRIPEVPEETDPFSFVQDDDEDTVELPEEPEEELPDEASVPKKSRQKNEQKFADPKYKRRRKRFRSFLVSVLILTILGLAGFWYYQNIYLIPIVDLILDGTQTELSVSVDYRDTDSALLVRCIDQFGKAETRGLSNGKTRFTGLQPNTTYTVQLETDGFHKLVGKTSGTFTTDANTTIVDFSSVAGPEDGSVVLNFTVSGEEPKDWTVFYSAEGEEEKRRTFTGHSVTVSELSVGKVYTFRLDTGENISLNGQTTLELMASRLILAEDITVTCENSSEITLTWDTPGDVVVDSWDVKCYNGGTYDRQLTVNEQQAVFSGLDLSSGYTVEITASGMTLSNRISITPNPIVIHSVDFDETGSSRLKLTWDAPEAAPEGGWVVVYNLAGGEKNVLKCKDPVAEISPKIPGAKYEISIGSADGTTVFNSNYTFTAAATSDFEKHNLTAAQITAKLLKTPDAEKWYGETVAETDFTDSFAPGSSISIAMFCSDNFYLTGAEVKVLYVLRDGFGNILPSLTQEETFYWKDIWNGGDVKNGELTLPATPTTPGTYSLELYFDGMTAGEFQFTIQ